MTTSDATPDSRPASPPARGRRDASTYTSRGLHGRVVETLGTRIVSGELEPGQIIDLDQLAADEDVSRTVVREAVKVLMGKGLLDARPKYGTFVRERAAWSHFDAEVMRWRSVGGVDEKLLRELQEVRSMLEPTTARLAAARRTAAHVESLEATMAELRSSPIARERHVEADLRFHHILAIASGNELLEALAVMLEPAQRTRDKLAYDYFTEDDEFDAAHQRVLDAVSDGDPVAAERAMWALIDKASRDIEAVISLASTTQQDES